MTSQFVSSKYPGHSTIVSYATKTSEIISKIHKENTIYIKKYIHLCIIRFKISSQYRIKPKLCIQLFLDLSFKLGSYFHDIFDINSIILFYFNCCCTIYENPQAICIRKTSINTMRKILTSLSLLEIKILTNCDLNILSGRFSVLNGYLGFLSGRLSILNGWW